MTNLLPAPDRATIRPHSRLLLPALICLAVPFVAVGWGTLALLGFYIPVGPLLRLSLPQLGRIGLIGAVLFVCAMARSWMSYTPSELAERRARSQRSDD